MLKQRIMLSHCSIRIWAFLVSLFTLCFFYGSSSFGCDELLKLDRADRFESSADQVFEDSLVAIHKKIQWYVQYGELPAAPIVQSNYAFPDLISDSVFRALLAEKERGDKAADQILSRAINHPLSFAQPELERRTYFAFADLRGLTPNDLAKPQIGRHEVDYFVEKIRRVELLSKILQILETSNAPTSSKLFVFAHEFSIANGLQSALTFKSDYPGPTDSLFALQKFGIAHEMPNTVATLRTLLLEAGYSCEDVEVIRDEALLPPGVDVILVESSLKNKKRTD